MINKKSKRGQINNVYVIGVLVLLLGGIIFAVGGNNGNVDTRASVDNTPDNSNSLDSGGDNYQEREEKDVTGLVDNSSNSDSGKYEVTNDCDDEGLCELVNLDTNETITIEKDELIKYTGDLKSNEYVRQIWFNNEFDVNGFNKHFQAFLIEDTSWNTFKLVWSVENEDFVIPNLKLVDVNDLTGEILGYNNLNHLDKKFFINANSLDYKSINVNSIVTIGNDEGLKIFKNQVNHDLGSGFNPPVRCKSFNILTNEGFNNLQKDYWRLQGAGNSGCSATPKMSVQFAISDNEKFSYDRIAVNSPTRTTGFNLVSVTKQEMTSSNGMTEKQAKILSKSKFDEVLNNGVGARAYTTFSDVNIKEVMSNFEDNAISMWGDSVNHNAYGLGTSQSEDFDYTDAFVIDGQFTTQNDISALEVGSYEFDSSESLGLIMTDDGLVKITGSQLVGENFGKFEFNNENSSLSFSGTAYVVNDIEENGEWVHLWDRIYSGMINLFDYSFDYSQWLSESATNGKFSPVDVYTSCGVNGCNYGYVSTFQTANTGSVTLVTQKPITELLNYNGKQYWSFWKLETKENNKEGCLIIDMPTENLGRIPVSVCDEEITGMNAFAQFKMVGSSEE